VTNPKFMENMSKLATDTDVYADFLKLMLDPQWYSTMMAIMDPAIMQGWMKMMMEPEMLDSMMKMMDPNLMVQFMRASFAIMNATPDALGIKPPSESGKK